MIARWPFAAALLAVLVAASACSTVPSTSATVQITQVPPRPDGQIGIEPLSPERGATPEEIVRTYIDAAASNVVGHPVAREHLTREAAKSWSDEAGITIISSDFATVTREEGQVQVTASLVGAVDRRGVFTVAAAEVYEREFTLAQVGGEWRITDPPEGLLMLLPDFDRLYDEIDLYFPDPTGGRIVPDPRYLISGDAQPTAVINGLLAGPSPLLAAGVLTPFSGVQLRTTVEVQRLGAVVDLTGVSPEAGAQLSQISATLVWTLQQLGIRTVEVQVDGESVRLDGVPALQTVDDWPGVDPGAVPVDAVGHYLDAGALRMVPGGEPAPGPAGTGVYALTAAAAVADPRSGELSYLVGVRTNAEGATLLAGPYGGELAPLLNGETLSSPTVSSTRTEAWVLRDGNSVVRIPSGGAPQAVSAPTLQGLGRAVVMRLSPDGTRAAVVVDGSHGLALHIGTVVRTEDGTVALRDLREIAPRLGQVVDVAWRDGGSLLVLAGDGGLGEIAPYSVGVDGFGLTDVSTAGLPSQPTAMTAAPGRVPLVSAAGTIWQLTGSTWTTLIRGAEPLPGTAPFYPL